MRETGRASQRIADEIRQRILDGELPPGTRIRQEQIAEEFGVSRLPIREALRILEAYGLVTLVASTGAWVSTMDRADLEETYLIRERIEPLAISLAIEKMSEATIDRLSTLADEMEQSDTVEDFVERDREFHLMTYRDSGMATLLGLVEKLWNTTQPYRRAYLHRVGIQGMTEAHLEHHLLVSAARRRDVQSAEDLLSIHIRKTRLALMKHPELFATLTGSHEADSSRVELTDHSDH